MHSIGGGRVNLLIIDDERSFVQSLMATINWDDLGIDYISAAYSIHEGIASLANYPFDILLTDIELQDGTCFDLIRWNNARKLKSKIIILSGHPNFRYAQKAISLGVFEYLLKPISPEELSSTISRVIINIKQNDEIEDHKRKEDKIIEKLKFYIQENISGNLSRDELASYVNFSPEYLSTYFKAKTGNTITDYIKKERIDEAIRLLQKTNLPISIIAENVGFSSFSYFSSVFKEITGSSPRQIRKEKI